MPPHLRFDRQDPTGWILAEGPRLLGEVQPDHMTFVGFPDAESAQVAAEIAARVLRQWLRTRSGRDVAAPVVSISADGRGFTFSVPGATWHALLFELAQRIHAATRSLRHLEPEPVS